MRPALDGPRRMRHRRAWLQPRKTCSPPCSTAAKRAGADAADALLCGKSLRQRLLPAGQAGGCRAQRKRRSGPAGLPGQPGGLCLLHRFFPRRPVRPAGARHRHGAGWRRKTNSPAWRRKTGWRNDIPALDLEDAEEPAPEILVERARDAEAARLWRCKGVTNSEGGGASFSRAAVALATTSGFYGRYAGTSHSIGVAVLAGEGTGMERDYDQASARHSSDLRDAADIGRDGRGCAPSRGSIPRKVKSQSVPVVFDPRESAGLLGHFAGAISGAAIARGVSFLKDKMGEADFRPRHFHHRRSAPAARPALQAVRRRRRRQPAPRPDREGPPHHLAAGLRQRPAIGA